jgi:heme exporter protein D
MVETNAELLLWFFVGVAVLALVGIVVKTVRERRTLHDMRRAAQAFEPRPRDLRVDRAPDVSGDYRQTLPRHARECNLRNPAR